MTCAVLPATFATKQFWAGDADHLVDDLIAACARKPVLAPSAGFGRELVPYFDTHVDSAGFGNLSSATARAARGASHPIKHPRVATDGKQRAGDLPSPDGHKQKRNKVSNKPGRSGTEATSAPSSPSASSSSGASHKSAKIPAVQSQHTAPGFQTSPKPEKLPMPTSSLFQRASASRSGASSPVLSSSGGSWSGSALSL